MTEKKYTLCLLVLSPNLDGRLLEVFRDVGDMAIILAGEGRKAEVPPGWDIYVCTYLPGDIRPGAKPIGPLKMLSICEKIGVS